MIIYFTLIILYQITFNCGYSKAFAYPRPRAGTEYPLGRMTDMSSGHHNAENDVSLLNSPPMRFLVINCENSTAWSPITFFDMFKTALGRDTDDWKSVEIAKGENLPKDIMEYKGVVLTGSRFNTRDKLPWFEELYEFIRNAASVGSPKIYGGCFGCQIIAVALGGIVDYNPGKRFALKAEEVRPVYPDFTNYLPHTDTIEEKPSHRIIVSHGDCVCELPPTGVRLATSTSCLNEMYVAGEKKNILACQSHPEFNYEYAVRDRIWRSVVEVNKRLSTEEIEIAKNSFEYFCDEDPAPINQLISKFLRS